MDHETRGGASPNLRPDAAYPVRSTDGLPTVAVPARSAACPVTAHPQVCGCRAAVPAAPRRHPPEPFDEQLAWYSSCRALHAVPHTQESAADVGHGTCR